MKKEVISTKNVDLSKGPYLQSIKAGNFIFVSGQELRSPKTGNLMTSVDIIAQTEIIIQNIELILEAADCTLDDMVKTNVFIKDLSDFQKFNHISQKYFRESFPARTTVKIVDFEEECKLRLIL